MKKLLVSRFSVYENDAAQRKEGRREAVMLQHMSLVVAAYTGLRINRRALCESLKIG